MDWRFQPPVRVQEVVGGAVRARELGDGQPESSAEIHSPIRLDDPARRREFGIDRLAGLFFRSLRCTFLPGRYILNRRRGLFIPRPDRLHPP